MARFLATLHSPLSKKGGIGIIDSQYGLIYLQIDSLPARMKAHQLRGMAFHDGILYVTTPAGILLYTISSVPGKSFFCLQRIITLPEWMLGGELQADLLGILISPHRNQLLVANNYFNSVDELTLDGVFRKRHFLSKLAPDYFTPPEKLDKTPFCYGHIRHIAETKESSILVTVGKVKGSQQGCVIDFDTGKIVLDHIETPHGGLFSHEYFLLQNVSRGALKAYPVDSKGNITSNPEWSSTVNISESETGGEQLNLRGMVLSGDSIFCGACHFQKIQDDNSLPHIVSFDIFSGKQKSKQIVLPDLEEFRQPRVFFLGPLPPELDHIFLKELQFFSNDRRLDVTTFQCPSEEEKVSGPSGEIVGVHECTLDSSMDKSEEEEKVSNTSDKVVGVHECILEHFSRENPEEGKSYELPQCPAVVLDGVNLFYTRTANSLFSFSKQLRNQRSYQALCDVSFTLYEGETVGVIGRNGSGKSTISMAISGALPPDTGTVTTKGRVQLLSIGLGFRNELTGKENVFINGALLGLSKKEIVSRLPDIEAFAELDEFIDEPVRTYSAGMRSRLGFAVATAVSPDILILDEVLSTGDAAFRKKANERMEAMRERTKTIIIISHSAAQIKKMCSRVIWLNKGRVIMDGEPDQVLSEYDAFCQDPQKWLQKFPV